MWACRRTNRLVFNAPMVFVITPECWSVREINVEPFEGGTEPRPEGSDTTRLVALVLRSG
jgi:hypothetical protein